MRIGIFSFRAFDRRLVRLAAPISSGVRQGGGAEYAPPSGARSAEYPSGARVKVKQTTLIICTVYLPLGLSASQHSAFLSSLTEILL